MRWRIVVCSSLLAFAAASCTSPGKCRRGDIGCACRAENTCTSGASCVRGSCVKSTGTMIDERDDDAGAAAPALCVATSFDAACRSYCLAVCRSEAAFCTSSRCEPDFCEPNGGGAVSKTCQASCGTDVDPTACVRDLCLAQTRQQCSSFGYEGDGGTLESACFNDDPICALTSPSR